MIGQSRVLLILVGLAHAQGAPPRSQVLDGMIKELQERVESGASIPDGAFVRVDSEGHRRQRACEGAQGRLDWSAKEAARCRIGSGLPPLRPSLMELGMLCREHGPDALEAGLCEPLVRKLFWKPPVPTCALGGIERAEIGSPKVLALDATPLGFAVLEVEVSAAVARRYDWRGRALGEGLDVPLPKRRREAIAQHGAELAIAWSSKQTLWLRLPQGPLHEFDAGEVEEVTGLALTAVPGGWLLAWAGRRGYFGGGLWVRRITDDGRPAPIVRLDDKAARHVDLDRRGEQVDLVWSRAERAGTWYRPLQLDGSPKARARPLRFDFGSGSASRVGGGMALSHEIRDWRLRVLDGGEATVAVGAFDFFQGHPAMARLPDGRLGLVGVEEGKLVLLRIEFDCDGPPEDGPRRNELVY